MLITKYITIGKPQNRRHLKFFNMKELPTTIHLPARFRPNKEHVKEDNTCPSGCSRIIRDLEMELEQIRFELKQTRRELKHSQCSLQLIVLEQQNARDVSDNFQDMISDFNNVNIN